MVLVSSVVHWFLGATMHLYLFNTTGPSPKPWVVIQSLWLKSQNFCMGKKELSAFFSIISETPTPKRCNSVWIILYRWYSRISLPYFNLAKPQTSSLKGWAVDTGTSRPQQTWLRWEDSPISRRGGLLQTEVRPTWSVPSRVPAVRFWGAERGTSVLLAAL